MRGVRRVILSLLIALLFAGNCWGADYYVPDDFATIKLAESGVGFSGDTVFIRPGTYNETTFINLVKTVEWIGIDTPIVQGAGTSDRSLFLDGSTQALSIYNWDIRNNTSLYTVEINSSAINKTLSNSIINNDGTVSNSAALRFRTTPDNIYVYSSTFNCLSGSDAIESLSGSTNVTITDNTFNLSDGSDSAANFVDPVDLIFSNNIMDLPILADATPILIVTSNGVTCSGLIVNKNIINTGRSLGYAISIGSEGTTTNDDKINGSIITGNEISSTAIAGSTHLIFVGHNVNSEISRNKLISNPGINMGIVAKHTDGVYTSGGAFFNLINNSLVAVRVKGVKDFPVYNQTIVQNSTGRGVHITDNDSAVGSEATGTKIKNTIIINDGNGYLIDVEDGSEVNMECDYNVYYSPRVQPFNYKGSIKTFAEWQALGFDANSIFLTTDQRDNLFVDEAAGDYRPKDGSIVRSAGVDIAGVTDQGDIDNFPFQGDNPDIGAYNYYVTPSAGQSNIFVPIFGPLLPDPLPAGYCYVVDEFGVYVVDESGNLVIAECDP